MEENYIGIVREMSRAAETKVENKVEMSRSLRKAVEKGSE